MTIVTLGAYCDLMLQSISMNTLKFYHLETRRSNLERRIPLEK